MVNEKSENSGNLWKILYIINISYDNLETKNKAHKQHRIPFQAINICIQNLSLTEN